MRDYTKIEAWKMADELVVVVYGCTKTFPKDEIYALVSQVMRAAYSVAANVAEGSARETLMDYLHFLFVARGALTETQYCIHLAKRLEFISIEECDALLQLIKSIFGRLPGLIKAVQSELPRK